MTFEDFSPDSKFLSEEAWQKIYFEEDSFDSETVCASEGVADPGLGDDMAGQGMDSDQHRFEEREGSLFHRVPADSGLHVLSAPPEINAPLETRVGVEATLDSEAELAQIQFQCMSVESSLGGHESKLGVGKVAAKAPKSPDHHIAAEPQRP